MDVSEYRKEYLEKLEKEAKGRPSFRDFLDKVRSKKPGFESLAMADDNGERNDIDDAVEIIRDSSENVEIRIHALNGIVYEIAQREDLIDLMIELLRSEDEPEKLRIAAIGAMQLSEFISAIFPGKRPQYLEILRTIVDKEQSEELRQQAIGILAKSQDGYVQERLLKGLRNEAEALVPPEKAIQLLGYDIHSEYFPVLQDIVKNPPNLFAKNEAVRLLAADADSKNLLAEILQDKSEHRRVRQTSAIALQSLAPAEFERQAEQIIFDDDEYEDIRATCINVLEGSPTVSRSDRENLLTVADDSNRRRGLLEKVKELKETASSKELKKVAKRYISNHKK